MHVLSNHPFALYAFTLSLQLLRLATGLIISCHDVNKPEWVTVNDTIQCSCQSDNKNDEVILHIPSQVISTQRGNVSGTINSIRPHHDGSLIECEVGGVRRTMYELKVAYGPASTADINLHVKYNADNFVPFNGLLDASKSSTLLRCDVQNAQPLSIKWEWRDEDMTAEKLPQTGNRRDLRVVSVGANDFGIACTVTNTKTGKTLKQKMRVEVSNRQPVSFINCTNEMNTWLSEGINTTCTCFVSSAGTKAHLFSQHIPPVVGIAPLSTGSFTVSAAFNKERMICKDVESGKKLGEKIINVKFGPKVSQLHFHYGSFQGDTLKTAQSLRYTLDCTSDSCAPQCNISWLGIERVTRYTIGDHIFTPDTNNGRRTSQNITFWPTVRDSGTIITCIIKNSGGGLQQSMASFRIIVDYFENQSSIVTYILVAAGTLALFCVAIVFWSRRKKKADDYEDPELYKSDEIDVRLRAYVEEVVKPLVMRRNKSVLITTPSESSI